MSPNGEGDAKTVEQPVAEVSKDKKPRRAKTASHPPYFQMIKEALLALNEKNGSSPYAIAKFMEEKHKAVLPSNFRKILALQLKNSAARGKLVKVKASYKLSEAGKKKKDPTKPAKPSTNKKKNKKQPDEDKARITRSASSKAKAANKPEVNKKSGKKIGAKKTKKSTPAKPKQPKSIRSPAATKRLI